MAVRRAAWSESGGDFYTGHQKLNHRGNPKGPGGMVCWRVNPLRYEARAWYKGESYKQTFKTAGAAKNAVLRWFGKVKART